MKAPMEIPMQLDPMSYSLAALVIWSHWGLWIWLDHFENVRRHGSFFGHSLSFLCGPAAWLTSFWRLTHPEWRRRHRLLQMQRQFWGEN